MESLQIQAVRACKYSDAIRIFREMPFPYETRLHFLVNFVPNFYLCLKHFSIVSTNEGASFKLMNTVFDSAVHTCNPGCTEKLRLSLAVMRDLFAGEDYMMFLFIMDKYCEHGLEHKLGQSMLRSVILDSLFPLAFNFGKTKFFNSANIKLKYAEYTNTPWYRRINPIYESMGKFEMCKPHLYTCFHESLLPDETVPRTQEAQDKIKHIAELLSESRRPYFLTFCMNLHTNLS